MYCKFKQSTDRHKMDKCQQAYKSVRLVHKDNDMINASTFYDLLTALSNDELCRFFNTLAWRIKFPNGGDTVIDYDKTKFGTIFCIDMEFFNVDRVLYDEDEMHDILYTVLTDIYSCHNDEPEEGDTWTTAIELYAQMFNVN